MSKPIVVIVCMARSSESWGLNSAHIHGTDVPVEEPSTASNSEVAPLFNHLFGAVKQRWRTSRLSAFAVSLNSGIDQHVSILRFLS